MSKDFSGRSKAEQRLAKRLAGLGQEVYQEIIDLLGDPPDISKLTPDVWRDIERRYTGAVRPELEKVFLEALDELVEALGFAIDWEVANTAAADWARGYTFDLVTGITDTSRTMLQQAVSDFFEQALSIDDLRDKISGIYGPVRAEMIAVTEVTRAVAESGKLAAAELEKQGVKMQAIHNTSNDGHVCPVCAPRNQQPIEADDQYPPLHIRCRCWPSYEPVET